MELREYLNSLSHTDQVEFAKSSGTTINYLRKGLSTKQKFSMELCIRLEQQSGGAICAEEIRPDLVVEWEHYRNRECPCNQQAA